MSGHVWRDALPTSICKEPVLQHKAKVRLTRAMYEDHNVTCGIKIAAAGRSEYFCIM